ncbi:MAG: PQQ-binding-like beta-propeller repeat protein [Planctomycetota bacterium]
MPENARPAAFLLVIASALACCAAAAAGNWPQFRGPNRDNIAREAGLLRTWPEGGPAVLWSTPVCEGYAGAAVVGGRVYFEDYGKPEKEYYVRCLDLADGKELWRFKEAKTIRPNHGITRAVVATDGRLVFALDPKCILHALEAASGREVWRKDLVEDYQAQIPAWYNGQCPLLDGDRLVIGVGGQALLVAFDAATGTELWRTPNPQKWPLSHASVMPGTLGGVKQYTWCTLFGPLGVAADDGRLLWRHARKFNVAVAPSPLPITPDRVFMTSGYDAGTVFVRLISDAAQAGAAAGQVGSAAGQTGSAVDQASAAAGQASAAGGQAGTAGGLFKTEAIFDWPATEWNAEVHTPILWQDHLYAVGKEKRGLLTCLDLTGKRLWTSAGQAEFDLGSFLLVEDPAGSALLFILEGKTGTLRLIEPNPTAYRELAAAQVLSGDNVWGPMALSDGRLVVRDLTKMVCLKVAP